MPLPSGGSLPIAKWVSLRQAIQWIAFDLLPLPEEYEVAEGRPTYLPYSGDSEDEIPILVRRAQAALFQVLYEGRLGAQGRLGIAKFGGKDDIHELGEIAIGHEDKIFWWSSNKYAKEYSDIPPTFWQFHTVDWNQSHAWRYATDWNENIPLELPDEGIDYINILVRTDDLLKVIPAGGSPIDYTIGTVQLNEAAPASDSARAARPILPVRQLGRARGAFGHLRRLSGAVEPQLCPRGPYQRPAGPLLQRRLALPSRPGREPRWVGGHYLSCNHRMKEGPITENVPPSARDGDGKSIDPGTGVFPILKELEPGLVNVVGTGFYISRYGLFLTAKHVLLDAFKDGAQTHSLLTVHVNDHLDTLHIRRLLRFCASDKFDLALGVLENFSAQCPENPLCNRRCILTTEPPPLGSRVVTFAYPENRRVDFRIDDPAIIKRDYFVGKLLEHVISNPPGEYARIPAPFYKSDVVVKGGASGGPVFDKKGRVFAVNSASMELENEHLSWLTRINEALHLNFPVASLSIPSSSWEHRQL
jgi:hypothetical protein